MSKACFFEAVVDRGRRRDNTYSATFVATSHTASPWHPDYQHVGPAAALMVRAAEQLELGLSSTLTNMVAIDIQAPLPVGAVTVSSRVLRAGSITSLIDIELCMAGSDETIMSMSAWRTRCSNLPLEDRLGAYKAAPREGTETIRPAQWGPGFADAMEWRLVNGSLTGGRATVWARPAVNLVDDEPAEGVNSALLLADSAASVSALADPRNLLFTNTDLTVHLVRQPQSEWLWMRTQSFIDPDGIGLTNSRIGDEHGSLGFGNQSIYVADRHEPAIASLFDH